MLIAGRRTSFPDCLNFFGNQTGFGYKKSSQWLRWLGVPWPAQRYRRCALPAVLHQLSAGLGNSPYINMASKRLSVLKELATRMRLPFRERVGVAKANMLRSATTTLEVNNWSGTSMSET